MSGRKTPPRKDRLIQTRVPQNLESTLKDEARRRRLSVSHLIRNVLEDTFNLVDNVVVEVDKVVNDSVEMAQTLRRDARKLAASARGDTDARTAMGPDNEPSEQTPAADAPPTAAADAPPTAAADAPPTAAADAPPTAVVPEQPATPEQTAAATKAGPDDGLEPPILITEAARTPVAWMPAVVNQDGSCCNCQLELERGKEAFLGLAPAGSPSAHWLCARCRSAL